MRNGLIIDAYGTKRYYLNGQFHREGNLPACEYLGGDKSYYIKGILHRKDSPAVENSSGTKFYLINGKEFSEENYWKEIKRRKSLNYILSNLKELFNKAGNISK